MLIMFCITLCFAHGCAPPPPRNERLPPVGQFLMKQPSATAKVTINASIHDVMFLVVNILVGILIFQCLELPVSKNKCNLHLKL